VYFIVLSPIPNKTNYLPFLGCCENKLEIVDVLRVCLRILIDHKNLFTGRKGRRTCVCVCVCFCVFVFLFLCVCVCACERLRVAVT
jgi:hypothetical protein